MRGRSIADNILMMQEVIRGYYKTGGAPRCAMKIDIMRADSVKWAFLFSLLEVMNFPKNMISWIKECDLSTVHNKSEWQVRRIFQGGQGFKARGPNIPLSVPVNNGIFYLFV